MYTCIKSIVEHQQKCLLEMGSCGKQMKGLIIIKCNIMGRPERLCTVSLLYINRNTLYSASNFCLHFSKKYLKRCVFRYCYWEVYQVFRWNDFTTSWTLTTCLCHEWIFEFSFISFVKAWNTIECFITHSSLNWSLLSQNKQTEHNCHQLRFATVSELTMHADLQRLWKPAPGCSNAWGGPGNPEGSPCPRRNTEDVKCTALPLSIFVLEKLS